MGTVAELPQKSAGHITPASIWINSSRQSRPLVKYMLESSDPVDLQSIKRGKTLATDGGHSASQMNVAPHHLQGGVPQVLLEHQGGAPLSVSRTPTQFTPSGTIFVVRAILNNRGRISNLGLWRNRSPWRAL